MEMEIVQGRSLTKEFQTTKAIDGLTFQIRENAITGLIGRNGAGKTTLLKLITGYLKPTHGQIKVFARSPFNDLTVAANLIFVDDHMVFPKSLTLEDILKEAAVFYENWDKDLAQGLFDYFSLNPKQSHSNLSKGSKSLFNCIIGIASRCPLTIFDEPTTGMDSAVRKDFYRALLKDYIAHPRTILLSSHLLNELDSILEDIMLIKRGQQVLHCPVSDLKEYAIGLKGSREVIFNYIRNKDILYQEEFGKDNLYVVVKRESIADVKTLERHKEVEVVPVSVDDICVYLTAQSKGGIDDVFKRG